MSALVLAIYLGKRRGYNKATYRIHNIPFVVIGAALLWFGWYGFNAGSALAADGLAAHAFMTTSISAATALLSWMLIDTIKDGKPTLVGACTGLVVGLVAITREQVLFRSGHPSSSALFVSPICYTMMNIIKQKLKIDDSLDAFGCHGIGGIWGGIATGLFGQSSINSVAQWDGLVFGETKLFVAQIISNPCNDRCRSSRLPDLYRNHPDSSRSSVSMRKMRSLDWMLHSMERMLTRPSTVLTK